MPDPGTLPLLRADGVSKRYGALAALTDLSFSVDSSRPSITAVVGESGSGKTTLARVLLGLITPSEGRVLYQGRDMMSLSRVERRGFRRDVQAVFQDPYEVYNPFYRVDHVLWTPVRNFGLASSRAEGRALIGDALRAVGLRPEEILGRFPHQLSGGQRQRIMVARAVLMKPKLIVADEPVSMVDASLRATILGLLRGLTDERGISILYITHDLATAYQVSDNILVMYRSRLVEAGAVEPVVKHPRHPYTRMLVASIPKVATTRDWLEEELSLGGHPGATGIGCRFADRCSAVMPRCAQAEPPLFRIEANRASACFLDDQASVLEPDGLNRVLHS